MANSNNAWQQKVEGLCRSQETLSSTYAKEPTREPSTIGKDLFGHNIFHGEPSLSPVEYDEPTPEDLEWALRCGKFEGTTPSKLFLTAYRDTLRCLDNDPLANCVSPALCGTTGYVPVSIIAPLHDQLRHMSNLIAAAKKEVLLATNYWKGSKASQILTDSIRELSRRAGERGDRVRVLVMYDRGNAMQVITPHQDVSPKTWTSEGVQLPAPEDIPNVDMSVVNFHHPPLGTFHAKFMIVDREIATVSSNNVQDNDNVEMLAHLEGPIVDSIWEAFFLTFNNKIDPPLPCRESWAASKSPPSYQVDSFKTLFTPDGAFRKPEEPIDVELPEHLPGNPHYDNDIAGEITRMRSVLQPRNGEREVDAIARHLNQPLGLSLKPTAPDEEPELHYFPFMPIYLQHPVPMAMASRKPYSKPNNKSEFVPQNEAFASLIRNAKRDIFIQTPDLNAKSLLPIIADACKRGVKVVYYVCFGYNDTGELLPGQGGTNEMAANALYKMLDEKDRHMLEVYFYVAPDQDHPINNIKHQRSCHIKLLIADGSVAVQGSGNQDTQSWYHSQELNVMVDSPEVCTRWREGIERNQNTRLFGRAREDGCWYDKEGVLAEGSYGTDAGKFAWAKGIVGIVNKARGA